MTALRAGLMIPHPGAGTWEIADARTVRLWVDPAGVLRLRDRDARVRQLASSGTVQGCWGLADRAAAAVGLPVTKGGWLVLSGAAGPVLALRVADWALPGWDLAASATLEIMGAHALAAALGTDVTVVTDPAEAVLRLGTVDRGVTLPLDQPPTRAYSAAVVGTLFALLVAYPFLLLVCPAVVATAIALAGLLLMPIFDLVPLRGRYRRTATLPGSTARWWAARPARPGAGIGVIDAVAGRELMLADGYGWEGWYPGPALGGAASLVFARDEAGVMWGLLLYDSDHRLLQLLDARDWVGDPGAVESLSVAAADLGLDVSLTTLTRQPVPAGRGLSRSSGHKDVYTGLGAMVCAAGMSVAFACIALTEFLFAEAYSFFVAGAVLLVVRVLFRFRRVV